MLTHSPPRRPQASVAKATVLLPGLGAEHVKARVEAQRAHVLVGAAPVAVLDTLSPSHARLSHARPPFAASPLRPLRLRLWTSTPTRRCCTFAAPPLWPARRAPHRSQPLPHPPASHPLPTPVVTAQVHEVLRLPARAVASRASAALVNGVLSFRVPVAALDAATLAVAPEPSSAADAKLLFEAPVPGVGAADLKAEVHGRTLVVSNAKQPSSKANIQARLFCSGFGLVAQTEGPRTRPVRGQRSIAHAPCRISAAARHPRRRRGGLRRPRRAQGAGAHARAEAHGGGRDGRLKAAVVRGGSRAIIRHRQCSGGGWVEGLREGQRDSTHEHDRGGE